MKLEELLRQRSGNACELCQAKENLSLYEVPPVNRADASGCLMVCDTCLQQIDKKAELDGSHWQCLDTAMWSEVPAIQVVSWRMLNRLKAESWATDLLDMLFLEEDVLSWAKAMGDQDADGTVDLHKDTIGQVLQDGDSVILTRSLDVKGANMNAKMGTVVKNIRLVPDNTDQIEGKIDGQVIVILTKYLRKQN